MAPSKFGGGRICDRQNGAIPFDDTKPNCIIVVHDSSRTGCPIHTWSMLCELNKAYNVLAISLKSGPLDGLFKAQSTEFVVFNGFVQQNSNFLHLSLLDLISGRNYLFAIVNGIYSWPILPVLSWHRIPSIVCVHEFAQYCSMDALRSVFQYGTQLVYSSRLCLQATANALGIDTSNIPVLPQGKSALPVDDTIEPTERERCVINHLRHTKKEKNEIYVLGCGTVEYRKGFDLFIRVAGAIKQKAPGTNFRFLWAGAGYDPERDFTSKVIKAQIDTLELGDSFEYLGFVQFIDKVYELCDLFLLTSILDPLPGVAIEAMSHSLPVLCFDKASGFPEMFRSAEMADCSVVPYLDLDAMAEMAVRLANDRQWRERTIARQRRFYESHFDMAKYVRKLLDLVPSATK